MFTVEEPGRMNPADNSSGFAFMQSPSQIEHDQDDPAHNCRLYEEEKIRHLATQTVLNQAIEVAALLMKEVELLDIQLA